ncbi:Uu.00g016390.m01.CDS01 [Anthostomella pinea]|uniref:Uu.00g016390.m01.CDS01 n=1 Tax=Anthostomella pinea TaxID=933095 RepID=A0AAI8YQI8_9PEZI|nr:Uu.00g016390.m01.CDS01 [Anthostomella pinea]
MSNWTALITPMGTPAPTPAAPAPTLVPIPDMKAATGPPYIPNTAVSGGVPSIPIDDPICGVLLLLFLSSAAAHMTILQLNKRRGLRFVFSGMLFALCMLRSIALTTRLAWASRPHDVAVAVSAGILTQVGSVLVFVIDLFFAQRVLRAYHPRLGWHPAARWAFRALVFCVVACLVMLVAVSVQSLFTLNPATRHADRIVQLFAGAGLAVLAFIPIPVVLLAWVLPRRYRIDKFGSGRWRSKLALLLFCSAVATLGAAFRIGTEYLPARPRTDPAWYHSRACYYCFNYVTDLVVSAAYLLSRFDRRFIIPNGARAVRDYSRDKEAGLPRGGGASTALSNSSTSTSATKVAKDANAANADEKDVGDRSSGSLEETDKAKLAKLRGVDHQNHDTGGKFYLPHHHPNSDKKSQRGANRLSDRSTVVNSEEDAFGPEDKDDPVHAITTGGTGTTAHPGRTSHNPSESTSTTDVDASDASGPPGSGGSEGAELPGNILTMIENISSDGRRTSASLTAPEPAYLARERGGSGDGGGDGRPSVSSDHAIPPLRASLTDAIDWRYDGHSNHDGAEGHGEAARWV